MIDPVLEDQADKDGDEAVLDGGNNECEAERALAAGWRVLDSYGVTATPPKLRRQGLALHASADERHLGAAATRAVLSSVLAALAS